MPTVRSLRVAAISGVDDGCTARTPPSSFPMQTAFCVGFFVNQRALPESRGILIYWQGTVSLVEAARDRKAPGQI